MFARTDVAESPWYVVDSEDKRRARINMMAPSGHCGRHRPTFPTTPPRRRELRCPR
ncbi:MAG: hypothetical protein JO364_15570 [Pseudonocardiales bacterium]|nr:hypothetical protein [Pseudonocardiales bacterium]MBV9031690.1 hypothetical protein [Pseudonocardiales bacterium]